MGLEPDDILMEIKGENIPNKENGKGEKKMEKKDNSVELLTKGKDDSEKTKEKENNKNENFDLQVCDEPSCTNTANKKCSRCFFKTIINITITITIIIITIITIITSNTINAIKVSPGPLLLSPVHERLLAEA